MADPGFPNQHTTTTTVTNSHTTVRIDTRFDPLYIRTIPGILKVAQIAFNLLGFICIEISAFSPHGRGGYFNSIAMTGFWFTGIMLILYLFHLIEKFYQVPWLKIELTFCSLWTVLYFIAVILAITFHATAYIVAGFFGICATIAYGFDAYIKLKAVQNGELAQGERVVNKHITSTITSPAY